MPRCRCAVRHSKPAEWDDSPGHPSVFGDDHRLQKSTVRPLFADGARVRGARVVCAAVVFLDRSAMMDVCDSYYERMEESTREARCVLVIAARRIAVRFVALDLRRRGRGGDCRLSSRLTLVYVWQYVCSRARECNFARDARETERRFRCDQLYIYYFFSVSVITDQKGPNCTSLPPDESETTIGPYM